jgi:hypothetical protein
LQEVGYLPFDPVGNSFDRKDIQSVVQVFAKAACRDDPHICVPGFLLSHAFVTFLLQNAQQFALHFQRDFADLVQEQGSSRRAN